MTNPLDDVLDFVRNYDEKYSPHHPVFYQGTYSQVLNDAKRELKFLLIYLHNEDAVDTSAFCRLFFFILPQIFCLFHKFQINSNKHRADTLHKHRISLLGMFR